MKLKYKDALGANLKRYYLMYILIILIIIFSILLFKRAGTFHQQKILNQHRTVKEYFMNRKNTILDVDKIESWMTFRYINDIFLIPEDYLKDKLKISDKKYPDMPLGKYSKNNGITMDVGLGNVKNTLKEFLKVKPIKK